MVWTGVRLPSPPQECTVFCTKSYIMYEIQTLEEEMEVKKINKN